MTHPPLVTIGAVTSRPAARDFLWWNIDRQTYPRLEVVDSTGLVTEDVLGRVIEKPLRER